MNEARRGRVEPAIVPHDPVGPLDRIQGLQTPDMGATIVSVVREGAWRTPVTQSIQEPRTMANEPSDDRMPRSGKSAIVLDDSVDPGERVPGLSTIDGNVIMEVVRRRAWETTPEKPVTSKPQTTIFEK